MTVRNHIFQGPGLVIVTSIIVGLLVAGIGVTSGFNERGLHLVIRTTAQTSLVLFLAAFTASALLRLSSNGFTRWLRKNRRYIGISFAVSHTFHALAIITLGIVTDGKSVGETSLSTLIGGGLAYLFILAMAATSSDRAVRRLGYRRWQTLHSVGMYYIWFIFIFTYGGRAAASLTYALPASLLLVALALRIVSSLASRRALATKRA